MYSTNKAFQLKNMVAMIIDQSFHGESLSRICCVYFGGQLVEKTSHIKLYK
jgi:hypothetical protein